VRTPVAVVYPSCRFPLAFSGILNARGWFPMHLHNQAVGMSLVDHMHRIPGGREIISYGARPCWPHRSWLAARSGF
jgi:hypothetical protein